MAGNLEFGWQQGHQPAHNPIFQSSHSVNVRCNNVTEAAARKKWRRDAEARKKLLQQEAETRKKEGAEAQARRATRCNDIHNHGKSAEHHTDEHEEHHTTVVEEPFVPWTPYVPENSRDGSESPKSKSKSSRTSQSDETIEKEIGTKRLWAKAHQKAQVRMNEFRYQKAMSDATGNVHKFLLYSKSQASVQRLESLVSHHDFFTSSTRYRSLVHELANPDKALQAFEDSVDYESQCYFTQLSDALVPLAQNAKKRQAETQQLRVEMQDNERAELELSIDKKNHHQVHVASKELMDDSTLRLRSGVEKAMEEFADCAAQIIALKRDHAHRLAYYHKYWEEMGELERRQHYIQGIIQEVEDRRAELEKKERAKIEALEDTLKQLMRQADLLDRQCEEERLRSGSIFSWIVNRVEESQMANVEEMLENRFRRQQRESAYQRRAVVFRKSCLEREIKHKKIGLAMEQKQFKKDHRVANVLDLRLRSLEASGLLMELQLRKRDLTMDGCIWESDAVKNGIFQLILREMDAQLHWFAERCQPWQFDRLNLRLVAQPPLMSPLSLLRCSRELVERWQAQERLLQEMNAKQLERKVTESLPPLPTGRQSRSNSLGVPSWHHTENVGSVCYQADVGVADDDDVIAKPGSYTPVFNLSQDVEELIQERKDQEENGSKEKAAFSAVTGAAAAKRAFNKQRTKKNSMPAKQVGQETKSDVEEPPVYGRPQPLHELANLPMTFKILDWVGDQWLRLHGSFRRITLVNVDDLLQKMDDTLLDLQEARDIAETSTYWVAEGSRGPGVFSDMLMRDLSWLTRLADRIADRTGTLRAIVEMLTEVTMNVERGPFTRVVQACMHILRGAKLLVNDMTLQQAESWHLRLMKALHAEACFHGSCKSALGWYCGKFYGEGCADLNEISRGLNVLGRLLTGPQLVKSGALQKMMSSELFAEIRLALVLALRRDEPQAYESAMLALSVIGSSTKEERIGTTFPEIKMPDGTEEEEGLPLSGSRASIPMILFGNDQMEVQAAELQFEDDEQEPDADSSASSGRKSVTADELLATWASELSVPGKPEENDQLMSTGSTMVPNSTMHSTADMLTLSSPLTAMRFSHLLHKNHKGDHKDGVHADSAQNTNMEDIDHQNAEHPAEVIRNPENELGVDGSHHQRADETFSLSPSEGPSQQASPRQSPEAAPGAGRDRSQVHDDLPETAQTAAGYSDQQNGKRPSLQSQGPNQSPDQLPGESDRQSRMSDRQSDRQSDKQSDRASSQLEQGAEDASIKQEVCSSCGNQFLPDAKFCRMCGQKREEKVAVRSESQGGSAEKPMRHSPQASPEKLSASSPSVEDNVAEDGDVVFKPRPRELARSLIDSLFSHATDIAPAEDIRTHIQPSDDVVRFLDEAITHESEKEDNRESNDVEPTSSPTTSEHIKDAADPHQRQHKAGEEQHTEPRRQIISRMKSRKSIVGNRVEIVSDNDEHHHQKEHQQDDTIGLEICGHKSAQSQGADDHEKKQGQLYKRRRSSVHKSHLQKQGAAPHEHHDRHWLHCTTRSHLTGMHGEGADHWEHTAARPHSEGSHGEGSEGEHASRASPSKLSFAVTGHHIEEVPDSAHHESAHPHKARQLLHSRTGVHKNAISARNHMNTPNGSSAVSSGDSALDEIERDSAVPNRRAGVLAALSEHHWAKKQVDSTQDAAVDRQSLSRLSMHSRRSRRDTSNQNGRMSAASGIRMKSPAPNHGSSQHHKIYEEAGDGRLSVHGHHKTDVSDVQHSVARSGGDAVCSFADLAARDSVIDPDSPLKHVTGVKDETIANFLDHMLDDYEVSPRKVDPRRKSVFQDISDQIGHWLTKIEPEVASSALAEYKAHHRGTDADSAATTTTPETPTLNVESPRKPAAERQAYRNRPGNVSYQVVSPRFPAVAPSGGSSAAAKSSQKHHAGEKQKQKFQPSASDEHELQSQMHQQDQSMPWLKRMREDWQVVSERDSELSARVDAAKESARQFSTSAEVVKINPVTAYTAAREESSAILPGGRLCGTPSAMVNSVHMRSSQSQGAPGILLKTKHTLRTDKGLHPVPIEPWAWSDTVAGTGETLGTDNVALMLRDLRDMGGGSRSNSTRTTPASSRSPPKSLAKRRRRELHDSM